MAAPPRSPNGQDGYVDRKDYDVERQADHNESQRNQLTNTVTLSSEMFENLYLSPKNQQPNELRKRLANPTPIAIMGFVVGLTPLSCEFMTWRGSGGFGVATTTASIFFGGVLLTLGGVGEFILGNTFPFIVFMGYGAHFLTYSTTFMPFFNAIAFFNPEAPAGQAQITPMFAASYAFYPLCLGILSFIFLLGSLRTNVIFVLIVSYCPDCLWFAWDALRHTRPSVNYRPNTQPSKSLSAHVRGLTISVQFICATIGFCFAAAAFWFVALGNMTYGTELVVWTGACFFAASMLGWYLFLSIIIATMELPIPDLPVFDLSTVIPARSRAVKQE